MKRVDTLSIEDVLLMGAEFTIRWEPCPEGGVEILGVTLGNTDIMEYLDETTLETIAQELNYGEV